MGKKIKFVAQSKDMLELLDRPYPAISKLPDWLSNTPSYIDGIKTVDDFGDPNSTVKKCMPLIDSMTAGYHIPLHCDIWVENGGPDNINIKWSWDTLQVVDIQKKEQIQTYPVPNGYYSTPFKFINPWIVKTPAGWSSLFTHPLHYDDLPYKCLSAIVDTDKHPIPVNFLFFLNKTFSGLIQKGTPMIQVIPFKRDDFKSQFSYDNGFFKNQWQKAHQVFFDRYKRFFRSPKKYEQGGEAKCPFAFLKK